MSLKSTTKTLFNQDGYEVIVKDGISLPQDNAALLIAGSDGTDTHYISLDLDGNKIVAGAGTSGSPDGGVLSLQGTASENGDELKIMGHVDIDNFPTDLSIVQDNASELLASVGGLGASGSALVGNPMRLGAPEDGTYGSVDAFTNNIRTDSSGRLQIAGPFGAGGYGPGTGIAGAPVRLGASDGSLTTDILSDSSGRLIEVGAAAAGSAIAGAPVRLSGSDGTDTRNVLTDSAGRILFSGAAASGDAVAGAPVRLAGSDSTDTRDLLTDTAGRLIHVGAAAAGSAPAGNPLLTAGWDGTNVQIFKLDSLGAVQVNEVKSDNATVSTTAATTSSSTLLASNTAREGAIIYNNSNRFLYVRLGSGASSSSFTTRIAPSGQYLVPAGFTGTISGLWSDATAYGEAIVTEFAPGAGGGGGGGGGSIPDSSNLYSLLRRGINQTTTTNSASETVIAGWADARGLGLGHPKFAPHGRWNAGGGNMQGCTINGDGSVLMSADGPAGCATFMRSGADDNNNPLSNTTDGSWTIYARVLNQRTISDPSDGVDGDVFKLYQTAGGGYYGDDTGNNIRLFGFSNVFAGSTWRMQNLAGNTTLSNQYVPNPSEYQTVVLRGSSAQGWSFRLSNSNNSGGSFGSNSAYSDGSSFAIGSIIYLGSSNSSYPSPLAISDFAVYKSYHDDSTATQVISYLTSAP